VIAFQGEFWPVVALVLPVLVEQVLALSVGFTDKWLAGNLFAGAESLAAVGLVAYCLGFLPVLFAVPAVAATAVVARHVGAGERGAARRAVAQSFLIGAALTALFLVAVAAFGRGLVSGLGLPADSADLAGRYLAIVLPALPAMMVINGTMAKS
jgi:Na+-driven multidrug efflux pump